MKQLLLSVVAILVAAGIFTGMVLYSLSVIRAAQTQILIGELSTGSMGSSVLSGAYR